MIETSAIEQDEYPDYSVLSKNIFSHAETKEELLTFTDLDLVVTDSTTGRPVPQAMISIDSRCRTAVCDNQGRALIKGVLSGMVILDVIVWGYIASSTKVSLSGIGRNLLHIEIIRHS